MRGRHRVGDQALGSLLCLVLVVVIPVERKGVVHARLAGGSDSAHHLLLPPVPSKKRVTYYVDLDFIKGRIVVIKGVSKSTYEGG